MIESLTETLNAWRLTWPKVFLGLGVFAVTFVGSIAVVSYLLVRLPADIFSGNAQTEQPTRWNTAWWNRNFLGVVLI